MTTNSPRRWRMTTSAYLRILLAISILFVTYAMGKAQSPDPSPADDAPIEFIPPRSPANQAALDSIADSNPQTPTELFDAVVILQQFGELDEARKYFEKLNAFDVAALAEFYQDVGSGRLVKFSRAKELAPDSGAFVSRVFQASREYQTDPTRLKQQIADLANPETRKATLRSISLAGADAVPAILDAYRQAPTDVSVGELRQALVSIGPQAEAPLIAALGGPDLLIQAEAAHALGYVGTNLSAIHLLRPYHVGQPVVREAAKNAIQRMGKSSSATNTTVSDFIKKLALQFLEGKTLVAADPDGNVDMWTWSAQSDNVVRSRLGANEAAKVMAARLARDVFELNPTFENTRLMLTARLEVDQQVVGLDEPLPQGEGTAYQLAFDRSISDINEVLAFALEADLDAAAIGACEVLGDQGTPALVSAQRWTPLTRALRSPNRRVRYAAARAIMKIDPRQSFPGASNLLEVLIELASAGGNPRAIIGAPRNETGDILTGMMASSGYEAVRVQDGKSFLKAALQSSDHDVFLLSDTVDCPPAPETLQQLRQDPITQRIPVILLAREGRMENAIQLASRDDMVIVMPEFADETTLHDTLAEVEKRSGDVVPPTVRLDHAMDAMRWLSHLANYSQTYTWYDISRANDVAEAGVFVEGVSPHAIDLLGYVGLESSQQLLVDIAGRRVLNTQRRLRAANAFTEAVLRRGLMLRQSDVLQQYARYNASRDADQATQEILGQILDSIESITHAEL